MHIFLSVDRHTQMQFRGWYISMTIVESHVRHYESHSRCLKWCGMDVHGNHSMIFYDLFS